MVRLGMADEKEAVCSTDDLQWCCHLAQQAGDLHLDLSDIVGVENGPKVAIKDLIGVLAGHEGPVVALSWNDKTLSVQETSGGVLATFEIVF